MALGIEHLPADKLRPKTILPQETSLLTRNLRLAGAVIGEAIAPLGHKRPGIEDFNQTYAERVKPVQFLTHAVLQTPRRIGVSFADRKANQLLVDTKGGFITEYHETLDAIDHHGKSHVKRTKAGIELLDEHCPEISLPQWIIDAQVRFAQEHDANQAYQEYRILKGELSPTIDSKYGHGLGGAVMSLAMYKEYARVLHISEEKAKKISFATAIMEIAHDVPNQIRQAVGLTETVQKTAKDLITDGGLPALRDAFEHATLDLFSLTPSDMILLLQDVKKRKGFDTPYGLGPLFEEQYKDILAELAMDTVPLLQDIPQKDKTSIRFATLIAVISDMMDMILPNDEAFARMFTVPRAILYPLAWNIPRNKETWKEKTPDVMSSFEDAFKPLGDEYWREAQKLSVEELTVLKQIMTGGAITNAERKLLEAYEIGNIIEGTTLAENPTIKRMMEHYQAMTLIDIRHQVAFFMKGDREHITRHIHTVFAEHVQAIKIKLGENHPAVETWKQKLHEEADFVIDCLGRKTTGIHVYDPEEITSFTNVSRMVERAFWTKQYMTLPQRRKQKNDIDTYIAKQMRNYEGRYLLGERPVTPTKNYHSTGSIYNARLMYRMYS